MLVGMSDAMPTRAAGWYPDPERPGEERYWDGARWGATERHTRPAESDAEPGMSDGEWLLLSAIVPFVGLARGWGELRRGHRSQGLWLLLLGVVSILVWAWLVAVV
jgi:hypothetical protein